MNRNVDDCRTIGRSAGWLMAATAFFAGTIAADGRAEEDAVLAKPKPVVRSVEAVASGDQRLEVRVDMRLLQRLQDGNRSDFMVELRDRPDLAAAQAMDWRARGRYVHRALVDTAERSQAAVREALIAQGATVESFWIKNVLWVRDGDLSALRAATGFNQVLRIVGPPSIRRAEPVRAPMPTEVGTTGIAENIAWVGADQVWAQGTLGAGVTVGVIDDGALYTHETLIRQYRGNLGGGVFEHDYNWFGPSSEPTVMDSAHGTHVLGIILGDDHDPDPSRRDRIGMAPGSRWMACNGFPDFVEPAVALLACGQFMLAPTRLDGGDPDPDRRPQIVNNSWSEQDCDGTANEFYRDLVDAWVAAGIFPAFAMGNTMSCGFSEPPGLSTLSSPASLGTAFAVGSTGNHDGQYATHSLWGPSDDASPGLPNHPDHAGHPQLKPQVVAPGVEIRSAMIGDDQAYGMMTGTSMSTPHITGLVALMLEAGECLSGDYAAIGGLIMQTARPVPYATGGLPPPGLGNVPNYATGWGEIDAPAAVNAAAAACGPNGFLRGVVTDKQGRPVAGARVEVFIDDSIRVFETSTDADGRYIRRLPVEDTIGYTVRVSAYGYLVVSESNVLIYDGQTTNLDTPLPAAPFHTLTGEVTDGAVGWPMHAKIVIVGAPLGPVWTDPLTGRYSVRLPEGRPFRFDVTTEIAGYRAMSFDLPTVSGGATIDIHLDADRSACSAPGYEYTGQTFAEDFNAGVLPAGWNASSVGLGWLFGVADTISTPNFTVPPHGNFAAANDELGADGGESNDGRYDYLVLPPQNLVGLVHPALRYRSFHQFEAFAGLPRLPATVEGSTDGGQTWTTLGKPSSTNYAAGWTVETVDLFPVIGPNVLIRFHADDLTVDDWGSVGPGWAIDDVEIRTGCTEPTRGGLVMGHVRDANTSVALNGVEVQVDDAAVVRTRTSADPGVGVGFYATYASNNAALVTAQPSTLLPRGYGDAEVAAMPADGATVRRDLHLPAGRLRLYPASPRITLELGTTGTADFTVSNTGTAPLSYGFEGAAIEEHFESAFPPEGWALENTGADCPWQLLNPDEFSNDAGGDGLAVMVDPYPCWELGDIDTTLVTPALDLSNSSTASIGFVLAFFEGADAQARLDVEATTDDGASWHELFVKTRENDGFDFGALIEVDLSSFVGHERVRVRFRYRSTPPWGWVIIDQVHLFNSINESAILDLTPAAGALRPGEGMQVQAAFDAGAVDQPGTYRLPIRISEDTPYTLPFGELEATMIVTAPASFGSVTGQVRSLGRCDAESSVVGGALISIENTSGVVHVTESDDQGRYRYWLDAVQGPFTITVEAEGQLSEAFQVMLSPGGELVRDIDMRLLAPCLLLDPQSVEATVAPGQSAQRVVDLLNGGPVDTEWTLRVGGDPDVLTPIPVVQTNSPTPESSTSIACIHSSGFVMENRYFRLFPAVGSGPDNSPVLVHGITFAVELAQSPQGTQPIMVRLHALDGELTTSNLTLLAEQTTDIADIEMSRISVPFSEPVSVAAGTTIAAELFVADGVEAGYSFYPGGNAVGEDAPAYHAARNCGYAEPISYPDLGFERIHLILELDVLASDPCGAVARPISWLDFDPHAGDIEGDSITPLTALFEAGENSPGTYMGSACLAENDGSATWTVVPVRMHVGGVTDSIFANGFEP